MLGPPSEVLRATLDYLKLTPGASESNNLREMWSENIRQKITYYGLFPRLDSRVQLTILGVSFPERQSHLYYFSYR